MGGLARVWLALAGLVGGVLSSGAAPLAVWTGIATAILSLRRRGPWRGVAIVGVAFALGAVDAAVRSPARQQAAALATKVPWCDATGRTLEDAGGLGTLASLDRIECRDHPVVDDAGAVFLDDIELGAGRRFSASGWLIPLGTEPFDRSRERAGAAAVLRVTRGADLGPVPGMHELANRVREGLEDATADLGAPGQLLRGLAIGDTSDIDESTEAALRRSGLAHLLAVSGSNVAILLGAVAFTARNASLRTRVGLCAAALTAFVAVVGPDASVLRAAGMGVVALIAVAFGRRAEPLHALGLALLAVVALRPGIVYSAGLHLSVAATLGIVLWARPLYDRLDRAPRPLAAALGATLAAQVAVAPLLVGIFGQLPLAGLPANLLAIPAVPPATVLGLAAGATAPWFAGAGDLLAGIAAPFSAWILGVGEILGEPAWASLSLPRSWGGALAVPVAAAAVHALRGLLVHPPS